MLIYLKKKAQSTAEYVIILGLVVGAVVAMQTYVKRGLQGRIRDAVDFTDQGEQAQGEGTGTNAVVQFSTDQYEPYYLRSQFDSSHETQDTERLLSEGAVERTLTREHSGRKGEQTITGDRRGTVINE